MSKYKYTKNVSLVDRLFGIKCPHCKQRGWDNMRKNQYIRGYNNMCTQASGDEGFYCMACGGITFLISYEESRRIKPSWCTVNPDSDRAKWFPDFKHNRSVAHIPRHASHYYNTGNPSANELTP